MAGDREHDLERRVRARARRLWESEGRPDGGEDAFLGRARALIAIEDNPHAATKPVPKSAADVRRKAVEPIEAVENQGEFPTLTDQGEEQTPRRRRK
jgi:hypothetical protein